MHVLITADTVGGVWTYTQELVSSTGTRDIRVTLVSFGRLPKPEQIAWAEGFPRSGLSSDRIIVSSGWKSRNAISRNPAIYLELVVREVRPDLLHLNQYCYSNVAPWNAAHCGGP